MIRRSLAPALAGFLCLWGVLCESARAYPVPAFGAQDAKTLVRELNRKDGRVLGAAHRSDWRNHPENSLSAMKSCIDMGADMVELDVKLSKDGRVFIMHDETVDRTTNGTGNISDKTYDEMKALRLRQNQGGPNAAITGEQVPTLEEVLRITKGKVLVNLDHCFSDERKKACYDIIRKAGCLDEVVFKSHDSAEKMMEWFRELDAKGSTRPAYAIMSEKGDSPEEVRAFIRGHVETTRPKLVELVFSGDDQPAASQKVWDFAGGHMRVFVNTMWGSLCGNRPDDQVGWSELISRGVTMLQTDHISDLVVYLRAINSPRKASRILEAEHFNRFDGGLSVSSTDSRLNKVVKDFDGRDWLLYRGVVFNGKEKGVVAEGAGSGEVEVRLDSLNAAPVAVLKIDGSKRAAVALKRAVAGTHDVYLTPASGKVDLDSFSFPGGLDLGEAASAEPMEIGTVVGSAPALPSAVVLRMKDGTTALQPVTWAPVTAQAFSRPGTVRIKGRVAGSDSLFPEMVVTVRAVPKEVPLNGLVCWFNADEGVSAKDGFRWTSCGALPVVASQSSPDACPKLERAGGREAVCFDGDGQFLDVSLPDDALNGKAGMTLVAVSSSSQSNETSLSNNHSRSILYFDESGPWGGLYLGVFENGISCRFGTGSNDNRGFAFDRAESARDRFIFTVARKGGEKEELFSDGQLVESRKSPAAKTGNVAGRAGWIGRGKGNTYFQGAVAQLLVYDRALTDEELRSIQRYFDRKYGAVPAR